MKRRNGFSEMELVIPPSTCAWITIGGYSVRLEHAGDGKVSFEAYVEGEEAQEPIHDLNLPATRKDRINA